MIRSLFLAFFQLFDPAIRRVAIMSALGAAAVAAFVATLIGAALGLIPIASVPWMNALADISIEFGAIAILILMFPTLITAIASLFLEDVVAAVERRYYPDLPPTQAQSFRDVLVGAAQFLAVSAALNIAVTPLYFFPPAMPFAYFGLNGYLLGREYFEMVAFRRWSVEQARAFRRSRSHRLFIAGIIIAVMMTIPFYNVIAPIVACAFMVHVTHGPPRLRRAATSRP